MAMDLSVQTFSTDEKYFIADATTPIQTAVKTASVALDAHTPVLLDSDGKLAKVTTTDGTVSTDGIYGITADSAEADAECVVYLTGAFFADELVLEENVTAASIEVALRNIGIFLK